jgi:hypothetical protein
MFLEDNRFMSPNYKPTLVDQIARAIEKNTTVENTVKYPHLDIIQVNELRILVAKHSAEIEKLYGWITDLQSNLASIKKDQEWPKWRCSRCIVEKWHANNSCEIWIDSGTHLPTQTITGSGYWDRTRENDCSQEHALSTIAKWKCAKLVRDMQDQHDVEMKELEIEILSRAAQPQKRRLKKSIDGKKGA